MKSYMIVSDKNTKIAMKNTKYSILNKKILKFFIFSIIDLKKHINYFNIGIHFPFLVEKY